MKTFSSQNRTETIARLPRETFDVLIIGGGITGAGIVLDAAARGFRTALVEKRDFAAGTSSRSTKLIHGGLRYLEHFDFALVREALRERALLEQLAPHLVEPFEFVIPIYQQSERNYDHPLKMRAGLILYDLLAGSRNIAGHRRINRDEALRLAPQLDDAGLEGAFVYADARTDDARLVMEIIKAAHQRGASIANYVSAIRLLHDAQGKAIGAMVRDEISKETYAVKARIIINATSIWMNDPRIRPSKGIHLTVSAERLRVNAAWLIPALTGHRFYFVVPWQGRVNIGTTDTDYKGSLDAPQAEVHEVSEILSAVNAYFPQANLTAADVITAWAGLRPLISDGDAQLTTEVSRKEELTESADGVIAIAGGKLTTYRLMAERTVDLAERRLAERFHVIASSDQRTDEIPASGGDCTRAELDDLSREIVQTENLSEKTAQHLVQAYGIEAQRVIEISRAHPQLREPLLPSLPHIGAEIVYAVRYEMAVTLADVLTRRVRLAMLAGRESLQCASFVAGLMQQELGWNADETGRQIAAFTSELEREYSASSAPLPDTEPAAK
jgi:glycerol-3-phosphate dehydrogenase